MEKRTRRILPFLAIALLLLLACGRQQTILLENDSDMARRDEAVRITRAELAGTGGMIPPGQVPLLLSPSGDTIPSQVDDLSGDGVWDEMIFLVTMEPRSQVEYSLVYASPGQVPVFEKRTNIRMAEVTSVGGYRELDRALRLGTEEGLAAGVYHMEGPGWENDRLGFRNYLDARNGIDIFGKTTAGMILDRAGIDDDYHVLQPWGMDILRVVPSLGAGALALEAGGRLYRVAPGANGWFERVAEGPLRSVLRLGFDGWEVDGLSLSLIHEITITAGTWYYESCIYLDGGIEGARLVTGITSIDLDEKQASVSHYGESLTAIMTHGNQAYDGEKLGMAILLPADQFLYLEHVGAEGDDIKNTFLVRMPYRHDLPNTFRFYACWELSDPAFSDAENFYALVALDAARMMNPIRVSVR